MGRSNMIDSAIREIRDQVVDDITRILVTFGIGALVVAALRDLMVGVGERGMILPGVMIFALLVGMRVRERISVVARAGWILAGLAIVAANAVFVYGVSAPASLFFPTVLLLTWMIFGTRLAKFAMAGCLLVFAAAAWYGMRVGPAHRVPFALMNATWMYWANLGMVLLLVTLLIVATLRRLVMALVRRESLAQKERDRYQGMFEGLQDAVFVHSVPDGRVLERNASAYEQFGAGKVPGAERSMFPWTIDDVSMRFEAAMREGPQRFVCRGRRASGEEFWSEVAMRVFAVAGRERMVVSLRDIDDKIRHQLRLQRINEGLESRVAERTANLERSRKELESFSYAIAHDLRSPLRAVNGYGKVLQEEQSGSLDATGLMYVERIVAGTVRMGNLIDALLDLSRIDRTVVRRAPVDMARLARDCCEELEAGARTGGKAGTNRVSWTVGVLPEVSTDTELVRQILANLLSNAFKFSARTEAPEVRVGWESRPDGIWYNVSDNGCGFDMAQADKLFGVFQRLHDQSVEGLGIGLATVRRILHRLGGEIEVEAVPGKGAIFRFRPVGPLQVDADSSDSFEVRNAFEDSAAEGDE